MLIARDSNAYRGQRVFYYDLMLLHFRQNTKVYCLPISSHFYDDWISNATLKIVLKSPRCSGCRIVHKKDLNNDASKSLKNIPLCVKEASVTFIV